MILLIISEALLIDMSLSMDAFAAGFAYGSNKIKIPFRSVAVINFICLSCLTLSLLFGGAVAPYIEAGLTKIICFCLLFSIGFVKLFGSLIKIYIKKHNDLNKNIKFSLFSLRFILNVCASPEDADKDKSRVLSPAEAASLALALSIDGLAVGFGAGLSAVNILAIIIISLFTDMIAIVSGCFLGNKAAQKIKINLSWLSGVMLIALAFIKLLG
jgi:putative sporulation protein YtaF